MYSLTSVLGVQKRYSMKFDGVFTILELTLRKKLLSASLKALGKTRDTKDFF